MTVMCDRSVPVLPELISRYLCSRLAGSNPAVPTRWTFFPVIHHLSKRNNGSKAVRCKDPNGDARSIHPVPALFRDKRECDVMVHVR